MAEIFQRQEFHDPLLLDRPLTVTEVRISPDLRNATVFVLPLGGGVSDELMAALQRLTSHVRHLVGQRTQLRYAPQISFAWDTVFDQAQRIEEILHDPQVERDLGAQEIEASEDQDAS